MEKKRNILSILDCKSNNEYWTELDFEDMDIDEIEAQVGRFVIQSLLVIKMNCKEEPCMHLHARAVTEEQYEKMEDPKKPIQTQLEEMMRDVESGRGTADNS